MESNTATPTDLEAYVAGTTVQITKKKRWKVPVTLAFSFSKAISNSMQ